MPNVVVKQNFLLPKLLKSVFLKVKKDVWHIFDPPSPESVTYYLNGPLKLIYSECNILYSLS